MYQNHTDAYSMSNNALMMCTHKPRKTRTSTAILYYKKKSDNIVVNDNNSK